MLQGDSKALVNLYEHIFLMANLLVVTTSKNRYYKWGASVCGPILSCWRWYQFSFGVISHKISDGFFHMTETTGIVHVY